MDLSIVIVNWNTQDLLQQCLDSVFNSPPERSFDIWVVDNASSDNSVQMVETQFPQVNLIRSELNLGFGKANNIAMQKCLGKHILLLNPDTEVYPKALERLSAFLHDHPKVGVVGACLLYPDGALQTSCYPFPTLLREFWRLFHLDRVKTYGIYDQTHWDRSTVREVEVIQGAAFLVRNEVLDQVGLFDPEYFMYTEEVDLCYRTHKAGWDLYWVPQAEIIHHEGQSTKQMPAEMFLHLYKSKLLFFRKNHGEFSAVMYKLILGLASLIRLAPISLSKMSSRSQNDHQKELAYNYKQLLTSLREM